MEASFCGANFGRQSDCHFNSYDLEQMGHYFCDTILDFCDPDQSKVNAIRAELDMMYPPKKDKNKAKAPEDDGGDTSSDDVSDSGSDSGGEEGGKKKKKSKKTKGKSAKADSKVADTKLSLAAARKAVAASAASSDGAGARGSSSGGSARMHDRQFKDALTKVRGPTIWAHMPSVACPSVS
jgi:hypothetical protein